MQIWTVWIYIEEAWRLLNLNAISAEKQSGCSIMLWQYLAVSGIGSIPKTEGIMNTDYVKILKTWNL